LKLLQKSYSGQIKMIYIDPPYNTGNDFIYPDDYSENLETYLQYTGQIDEEGRKFSTNKADSGRFHTKWLNMMYPRLYLAQNLLCEDGVIFVSIDNNEAHNLRIVMNEIFGEENFVNSLVWVNNIKGRQITGSGAAGTYENILVYAKDVERMAAWNPIAIETARRLMPDAYKMKEREVLHDDISSYVIKNELHNTNSAFNERTRPKLVFIIHYNPETNEVRFSPIGSEEEFPGFTKIFPRASSKGPHKFHAWRWSKRKILSNVQELHFEERGTSYRIYTKIREYSHTNFKDLIPNISNGSLVIKSLGLGFANPKPPDLIKLLVQVATNREAIILDFFAGSATTAQAVLELNEEEDSNRKFIMVQLPEKYSDETEVLNGCNTIADIGKERLRRVINKIIESTRESQNAIGFKVFKLNRSNFKVWNNSPEESEEAVKEQLRLHVDHLNPDATQEDILYELLLKAGFPLTTSIEEKKMAGKTVFSIEDGVLLICLEKTLTSEVIRAMAEANPVQVVCLDEGFAGNDQLKTNAVQTFKSRTTGDETHRQIVFRTV